jgi:exopolysaccharide biosynthesis polyprenyl glycosylphosphotransferase
MGESELLSLHERGGVRHLHEGASSPFTITRRSLPRGHERYPASGEGTPVGYPHQRARGRRSDGLRGRLLAVDVVSLLLGWSVGWLMAGRGEPLIVGATGIGTIAVGVLATLGCYSAAGLYRAPLSGARAVALGRLVLGSAVAVAIVLCWQAALNKVALGVVLGSAASALAIAAVARYGFDVWLVGRRGRGDYRVGVVVAGTSTESAALVALLELNPEAGFHATAVVGEPSVLPDGAHDGVPWMGGLENARDAVERTGASGVLIAVNGLPSLTLNHLVPTLTAAGTPVYLSNGLTGVSGDRLQTFSLAHEPISLVRPPRHTSAQEIGKRVLDIVLASLLLVLAAPVMAVAAVLIKAHDGGPVLFRQVRVGRGGEPFTLVKLRTMAVDAESRLAELRHRNERSGPLFKVTRDPRITPIGGLLRSAAIDELPQLFNVLTGRMSIVGPRPALPAETAEFDDDLQRRHLVRPGVTGLWQVEANHKASFEEYRRLDLFYVDNWSVAMDLAIAIDTVPVIGRRALRALRRPAPSAPAPVDSSSPLRETAEVGP